jgi:hypothetical protein
MVLDNKILRTTILIDIPFPDRINHEFIVETHQCWTAYYSPIGRSYDSVLGNVPLFFIRSCLTGDAFCFDHPMLWREVCNGIN